MNHRASPASFIHNMHAASPNIHSAFLQPHHTPQARHTTIHASGDAHAATPIGMRTIASSINPSSSILFPSTNLQVSLLQMTIHDPSEESEIPPALPDEPIVVPPSPSVPSEYKHDEQTTSKRRADRLMGEKCQRVEKDAPQAKRPSTLSRFASFPTQNPSTDAAVLQPPSALLLASSFSFPPRHAYCTFRSTLDSASLLDILQHRLAKRGCRYQVCTKPSADLSAAAAAPGVGVGLTSLGDEEYTIDIVSSHAGSTIIALLSVRAMRSFVGGVKGRLVLARQIKSCDSFTFKAWFDSLFGGLHEE
jgi:hypothetical protein